MNKDQPQCHPLLLPFIPVTRALYETLGPDYEIVLHDTSGDEHFIVELCNGELTHRTKNSPMTDLGYKLLTSDRYKDVDYIANYESLREGESPMRSSVIIIRDEKRSIVGFLCINYDLTRATMLKSLADFLTNVNPINGPQGVKESFDSHPQEQMKKLLDNVKHKRGGTPLKYTNKEERLELLDKLDQEGFFSIKGSIEMICSETELSRFTIYRDLREVRALR